MLAFCVGARTQRLDGDNRGAASDDTSEVALVHFPERSFAEFLIEPDARDGELPGSRLGLHRRVLRDESVHLHFRVVVCRRLRNQRSEINFYFILF